MQDEANLAPDTFYPNRYYFSVWLYTYESFFEHPDWVIEFVGSTFSIVDPFGLPIRLFAQARTGKEIHRVFNKKNWQWCQQEFRRGSLKLLSAHPNLGWEAPTEPMPSWTVFVFENPQPPSPELQKAANFPWWDFPPPNTLEFAVELPLTIERVDQSLQDAVVQLTRTTFVKIGASYGFINFSSRNLDADGTRTEYEKKFSVMATDTAWFLRRYIRGAFWENYLTERHIEKLGGIDVIKFNAPCARVEELIPSKAIALRLTEDVNEVTPEHIKTLEQYLDPLAPRGFDKR